MVSMSVDPENHCSIFKKRATTYLLCFVFLKDVMVLINREFISKSVIGCQLQKADFSLRLPLPK